MPVSYGVSFATRGVLKPTAVPRGNKQEEQWIENLFSSCVGYPINFHLMVLGIVLAPIISNRTCWETLFVFRGC